MAVRMRCPECGSSFRAANIPVGLIQKCPKCLTSLQFPGVNDSPTVDALLAETGRSTQTVTNATTATSQGLGSVASRLIESALGLSEPMRMGAACVAGMVAATTLWWTVFRDSGDFGAPALAGNPHHVQQSDTTSSLLSIRR